MTRVLEIGVLGLAFVAGLNTAEAAPRTFVSGTGSDLLPCTRAAPCSSFQRALLDTDPGGEINCLDAGNFGRVAISQSVTIDCAGTLGGITPLDPAFPEGVVVNGNGAVVRLRNLTINGTGSGTVGIRFTNGAALFVESCVIANFNGGGVGNGIGIQFAPSTGALAELYVKDSFVTTNGRPADGGGVFIQPSGSTPVLVAMDATRVENNTFGLFADGSGATGVVAVQVRDSAIAANTLHGVFVFTSAGHAVASITLDRSSSLLNVSAGILAQGSGAFATLGESTVLSNGSGPVTAGGGVIVSYRNNELASNVSPGIDPLALGRR